MSSIMRRRSGLMVSRDNVEVIGVLLVLRLRLLDPFILKTRHSPSVTACYSLPRSLKNPPPPPKAHPPPLSPWPSGALAFFPLPFPPRSQRTARAPPDRMP